MDEFVLRVARLDEENAVVPHKAHPDDLGYGVTVIELKEKHDNGIWVYGTGLIARCSHGYAIEIHARNELCKSGYVLAEGTTIVEPSYRGELVVHLFKFDAAAPPLSLPARIVQIVPLCHAAAVCRRGVRRRSRDFSVKSKKY
jgi:dUTPase